MPRGGSYNLNYHCANSNHSKQNSPKTRLAAQNAPGGPGNAWMKSSSHSPRGAPMVDVHGVRAVTVSAAQVSNWLGVVKAQTLQRPSGRRCTRTMSTGEGGEAILRHMSSWRWCRIRKGSRRRFGRVPRCLVLCREVLLLAATLASLRLVPMGLISSPMLLSPLVWHSTSILLLIRWSHPAGPRIVMLMLRISPLLRLPWGCLL